MTLEDNVGHVVEVVRRVAEYGPVVLVGTSGGGATVTGVGNAVPDLLDRIVCASAWCCMELPSMADYLRTLGIEDFASFLVNWRSADPRFLRAAKEALMPDATDEQFRVALNLLEPADSAQVAHADARGRADTWGRIPHTYIRFSRGGTAPPALQDRMIAEADALTPENPFQVHTVDTGHLGVLLRPGEAARILDTLV
ncbi:alpha/beta fold hydrolase [Streptomyces luteireticuli]|uniref:alpha/beta fold hydrolase n=1 Tax=Streptomyces luteireticuli TaxID=173858 RepID=UPI0031DA4C18